MKQVPIKLGPLALLLSVISICLTALAILSFATARADLRLAQKFADTVSSRYALEVRGQELLRDLAEDPAGLPEGAETMADGSVRVILEQDGSRLTIGLIPEDGGYTVNSWRQEREWEQDTGLGNLWPGN